MMQLEAWLEDNILRSMSKLVSHREEQRKNLLLLLNQVNLYISKFTHAPSEFWTHNLTLHPSL